MCLAYLKTAKLSKGYLKSQRIELNEVIEKIFDILSG